MNNYKEEIAEYAETVQTEKFFGNNENITNNKMYRFNNGSQRFYFDEEIQLYPSVTTIVDKIIVDKNAVVMVAGKYGSDGYYRFMKERATYGTIMHACIEEYLMSGDTQEERKISYERISQITNSFVAKNNIDENTCKFWNADLKKDLFCIIQFFSEYKVHPIAIEYIGKFNDKEIDFKFAGAIDLICTVLVERKGFYGETYKTGERKGEPKETKKILEVPAIVDFKSGRNGFYRSHELQLAFYRMMITPNGNLAYKDRNGKDCFCERDQVLLLNIAPNKLQTTYKAGDQTDKSSYKELRLIYELYKIGNDEPTEVKTLPDELTGTTEYLTVPINEYLNKVMQIKQVKSLTN